MIRRIVRILYLLFAWLFVAGILIQVFIAGLGLFGSRGNWETHIGLDHTLGLLPLLMLVLVFFGGYSRSSKGLTALLFVNYLLLADFVIFIREPPLVAALHPVLALVLFATAFAIARRAWQTQQAHLPVAAEAA